MGGVSAAGGISAGGAITSGPPFAIRSGLFDQTKTVDLGLGSASGTETVTIFAPTATSDHYSNGVVMVGFKGYLYAQWQSSATDEDSADTWVAYSRSQDGKKWTAPMTLAPRWDQGTRTSGGFWTNGDTLVAYINVWPTATTPRGGYTEYATSSDGLTWTARARLPMSDGSPMNGVFEQDPHALANGRVVNAAHFQPGLQVAPIYSDDPLGISGWRRATFKPLSFTGDTTRELEPSTFVRADGAVVMTFRDQSSSYHRLASLSVDRGQTWTTPVETNMPDSRAKQSAGNLPNGSAYLVGNPVENKTRVPLAVALSKDGRTFEAAYVLRKGGSDLQAQRYSGAAKTLGYNYPKSMVYDGYLYVAYATNKEDVQYTRVPLSSLVY